MGPRGALWGSACPQGSSAGRRAAAGARLGSPSPCRRASVASAAASRRPLRPPAPRQPSRRPRVGWLHPPRALPGRQAPLPPQERRRAGLQALVRALQAAARGRRAGRAPRAARRWRRRRRRPPRPSTPPCPRPRRTGAQSRPPVRRSAAAAAPAWPATAAGATHSPAAA